MFNRFAFLNVSFFSVSEISRLPHNENLTFPEEPKVLQENRQTFVLRF